MSNSRNINTYNDIKAQLDQAVEMGGAMFHFDSENQAVAWRLRAYHFRNLYTKQEAARQLTPGYIPASPYDSLVLTLEGRVIKVTFRRGVGRIEPLPEAERIEPPQIPASDIDELFLHATELFEKEK